MLLDADGVLACCLCSLMRPGVEDVETQPMDHENMKRKRTRRDTTRRFSWLRACDVWVRCGCKCGMRQAKLQCEAAAIVRRWRECAQTSEENGVEELWLTQQNFQTFWTTFCLRSPSLDPFSPFPPNRYGQFHIGEPSSGGQAMASLPGPPTSRSADDVEEEQRPETRSPPRQGPGCHRPHRSSRVMKIAMALAAMAGGFLFLTCPCPLAAASSVGGRRHPTSTSAAFLGGLRTREPSSSYSSFTSSTFYCNRKHRRLDRLALRDGPSTQQRDGRRGGEEGEEGEEEEEESQRYASIMREMAERYD